MRYQWPILGHARLLAQLEIDLHQGRLGHAYLFAGPPKMGKRLVARTFAQILQCPNDFCRTCATCIQVEKRQHLDTLEFQDNGESIKIEAVRELLSHLCTTTLSRYKIVLLPTIERLTLEAANAFLKTLEEPISGVLFLLTTTQPKQLLETLLSRVRLIPFHPLSETEIFNHLKTLRPGMDPATLKQIASFSLGRPGQAVEFLEDADTFRAQCELYQKLHWLIQRSSLNERFLFVEEITQDPTQILRVLELLTHLFRGLLMQRVEGEEIVYSYGQLFAILQALHQARFDVNHNINARLALEHVMLTL